MKKSRYANVQTFNGESVIHNTLFGGMLKAKCDDSRAFLKSLESTDRFEFNESEEFHSVLKRMRMIVDDDVDESHLVDFYFMGSQGHTLFIIPIVTRQCNFRCTYCYEDFRNERMEEETWDNLYSVIEQLIEQKSYKTICISYFGGEPMLEYESICRFAGKIQELAESKNITNYSSMTTNAYLLTEEKLGRLTELGVQEFQITVDGFEETHDKARFLTGGGKTWQTIMDNLIAAKNSDYKFKIMLRTNFTEEIFQHINEYMEYMGKHFKGDERFTYHFEAVKALSHERNIGHMGYDSESYMSHEIMMTSQKAGLTIQASKAALYPFGFVCYASKSDSFTVDCDGTLLKCTIMLDEDTNKVGSIAGGKLCVEDHALSQWTRIKLPDKCNNCKIMPVCYGKKCPLNGSEEYCQLLIGKYEDALISSCM